MKQFPDGLHLGCRFTDWNGDIVSSFQLLRDGKAYATADFTNDYCYRRECAPSVGVNEFNAFLIDAQAQTVPKFSEDFYAKRTQRKDGNFCL